MLLEYLPVCWLCLTAVSLTIFLVLSESAAGWSTLVTLALAEEGSAGELEELVKAAVEEAFSLAAAAAAAAAALASRSSFFFCVICAYVFVWPS